MAEELGWYVSPDVMQPRSETQSQSESETVRHALRFTVLVCDYDVFERCSWTGVWIVLVAWLYGCSDIAWMSNIRKHKREQSK